MCVCVCDVVNRQQKMVWQFEQETILDTFGLAVSSTDLLLLLLLLLLYPSSTLVIAKIHFAFHHCSISIFRVYTETFHSIESIQHLSFDIWYIPGHNDNYPYEYATLVEINRLIVMNFVFPSTIGMFLRLSNSVLALSIEWWMFTLYFVNIESINWIA